MVGVYKMNMRNKCQLTNVIVWQTVLSATQDKALLRISELKEQCLLEQHAKAHLEEALRNELEERDHIINTLKTKVG